MGPYPDRLEEDKVVCLILAKSHGCCAADFAARKEILGPRIMVKPVILSMVGIGLLMC